MNKRLQQVLLRLKPKVKAFGFNKKEIQGVAAKIADNLDSPDDASDEDLNAEIDTKIDAVIPILEFGRSYANRVINDAKKNDDENNEREDDTDDESSDTSSANNAKRKQKNIQSNSNNDDLAKSFLNAIKELKAEISSLKGEKVTDSRRSRLETLLKDSGTFGSRTLKSFAKMKFDSDDDFDEFFAEVQDDLKALNQERANAGLARLGAPTAKKSDTSKKAAASDVLSDDEIKELAGV